MLFHVTGFGARASYTGPLGFGTLGEAMTGFSYATGR
ncbi:hypothetical protein DC347_20265 [Pseudarthrobacter sp. AG30]|nr:hypothetical protein DC347_20265 [Pseudarthrobacter sp. AG30]